MEELLSSPVTWIVIAALSELIALSPLKENSVVQVILKAVNQLKPTQRK